MTHDGGPGGRPARAAAPPLPATSTRSCSATRTCRCTRRRGGFHIFNPGSPTERRRAPAHTMGLATARDGRLEFSLVEL